MTMAEETRWAISLCEIGECDQCLYSWCCTPCALAQARTNLDGSSCCFNLCFLTSCPERWMIRTTYGIHGDAWEDCYIPCACPCCVANQMLQTTKQKGDPFGPVPGQHLQRGDVFVGGSSKSCSDCMCATFCCPCALSSAAADSTGMPWCMGCCLTTPCAIRNMIKVHYRIGHSPGDLCEDGLIPIAGVGCIYCCWPSILCIGPYFINWVMQILAEVRVRGSHGVPRYLSSGRAPAPGLVQAQVQGSAQVHVHVYPPGQGLAQVQVVPMNTNGGYGQVELQAYPPGQWLAQGDRTKPITPQYAVPPGHPAPQYAPPATGYPAQQYAPPAGGYPAQQYAPPAGGYPAQQYAAPAGAQQYAPPATGYLAQQYAPPAGAYPAQQYAPPPGGYPAQQYAPPAGYPAQQQYAPPPNSLSYFPPPQQSQAPPQQGVGYPAASAPPAYASAVYAHPV